MGKDINRYAQPIANRWVIFPYKIENNKACLYSSKEIQELFPLAWEYLQENKKELQNRENGKFKKDWWQYGRIQNLVEFDNSKISFPDISLNMQGIMDTNNLYHTTTIYSMSFNDSAVYDTLVYLGIVNSLLFTYYIKMVGTVLRGGYTRFKPQFMNDFPIAECSQEDQDKMSAWVRERLQLQKDYDLIANPTPSEIKDYESDTKILERKINKLVYTLYKLSADEIRMIEEITSLDL